MAANLFQKIVDVLYRHPRDNIKKVKQFGGSLSYTRLIRNRKLMQKASLRLSPVNSYPDGLPVYFLTGKKYLYQTLFCIRSLIKVSSTKFKFILVDDGTFNRRLIGRIKKQLPGSEIITRKQIEQNLKLYLPKNEYPNLHRKRKEYPHIKKLTDIHTINTGNWKLVLDSDMLFWHEPKEIINWLLDPKIPIHMVDCVESYGYSTELMAKLANQKIPSLLNVGVIGLNNHNINWKDIENWVKTLEEKEGKTYYLEQALTAMLIGNKDTIVLDKDKYLVNPGNMDKTNVVLHHYVDLSKKLYFEEALNTN